MRKGITRLVIGGLAAAFIYTDVGDGLMLRVFDKAKAVHSSYKQKFGPEENRDSLMLEMVNDKLNKLYDAQNDMKKEIEANGQRIIKYKPRLPEKSPEVKKAENVLKTIRDTLEQKVEMPKLETPKTPVQSPKKQDYSCLFKREY